MTVEINEKLQGIMQSAKLDDLPLKYLPPVSSEPDNYYFISYSHLDYKLVYSDIFALQAEGVNIWYDRAMPAGKSWKETAEKYISPSRCAGVVFYISENSLMSPAIHEEIAYAQKCGKSCLTINLPNSHGESRAVSAMLDEMRSSGADIPSDKYDFLCKSFNEEILYLPYSQSAEQKAEKIFGLEKPSPYEIEKGAGLFLKAVRDIDIREANLENICSEYSDEDSISNSLWISDCAFANCRKLERVTLPDDLAELGDHAFFGCTSLKEVIIPSGFNETGKSLFEECVSLEKVGLPSGICRIPPKTFCNCVSLKSVEIPDSVEEIMENAFEGCGIEKIVIPDSVLVIGESAFDNCRNLKYVYIPSSVQQIEDWAFDGSDLVEFDVSPDNDNYFALGHILFDKRRLDICHVSRAIKSVALPEGIDGLSERTFSMCRELTSVTLPQSLRVLGDYTFLDCESLTSVNLPQSVSRIPEGCFAGCKSLTELPLHNRVTCVGEFAFYECTGLTKIVLPELICYIDHDAFCQCENLVDITVPYGVSIIDKNAFSCCGGSDKPVSFKFNGTKKQWKAVNKHPEWNADSGITEVICTDGVVKVKCLTTSRSNAF